MSIEITINRGDSSLLPPIITAIWRELIPPLSGDVISYSVVEQNGMPTLLLFASRGVGTGTLVPNSDSMNVTKELGPFIQRWLRENEPSEKPAPGIGGSYFKGFWLSNENLGPQKGVDPILAIKPMWIFYEK
ncbi:MAG TPA: hypothetical protein VHQ41_01415 [Patescibacteria group bacterium]|jgi:hypothetical protein|nr:hypothetical protein [Patescibacteria group bacterium]